MNYYKVIFILIVASFSPFCLQAQEERLILDSIIVDEIVKPDIKLNSDSVIASLRKEIHSLKEKENELKNANFDKDQIIKDKEIEISRLKNHLIFADSIIARVSNDCLRKKFDKTRVDEAIVYYRNMYSPELQSKFSPLERLLTEYSQYSKEISDILVEAENDRDLKNPFTGQKKALSYIDRIKSTRYYQDVYNDNWTIPYMNKVIDQVIHTLKNFDPKVNKQINLLDKLN